MLGEEVGCSWDGSAVNIRKCGIDRRGRVREACGGGLRGGDAGEDVDEVVALGPDVQRVIVGAYDTRDRVQRGASAVGGLGGLLERDVAELARGRVVLGNDAAGSGVGDEGEGGV